MDFCRGFVVPVPLLSNQLFYWLADDRLQSLFSYLFYAPPFTWHFNAMKLLRLDIRSCFSLLNENCTTTVGSFNNNNNNNIINTINDSPYCLRVLWLSDIKPLVCCTTIRKKGCSWLKNFKKVSKNGDGAKRRRKEFISLSFNYFFFHGKLGELLISGGTHQKKRRLYATIMETSTLGSFFPFQEPAKDETEPQCRRRPWGL